MVLTTGNGQIQVSPIADYQLLERAFNAINTAVTGKDYPRFQGQE